GLNIFRRLSPRAGVTWTDGAGAHELFASVSRGFRAPAVVELGCADPQAACPLPFALGPDPALKPVVATTYELGWRARAPAGRRAPDGAGAPRECRAHGTDPPFPWNRDRCGALGWTGRPLRGAAVAAGRRGERHSAARRLRRRRPVAHADLARLRAARRGAKSLRPTLRQLRDFCRESHGDVYADPALPHARTAEACAGEPEYGLLTSWSVVRHPLSVMIRSSPVAVFGR